MWLASITMKLFTGILLWMSRGDKRMNGCMVYHIGPRKRQPSCRKYGVLVLITCIHWTVVYMLAWSSSAKSISPLSKECIVTIALSINMSNRLSARFIIWLVRRSHNCLPEPNKSHESTPSQLFLRHWILHIIPAGPHRSNHRPGSLNLITNT